MVALRRQRHLVLVSRSADMRIAALSIALFCLGSVCASSLSYVSTRDPFAMEVLRAVDCTLQSPLSRVHQDPFESMKAEDNGISNDLPERVAALSSFAFTTHVDVVMVCCNSSLNFTCHAPCCAIRRLAQVCFSGDGNYGAIVTPSNLDRLFQAAVVEVTACRAPPTTSCLTFTRNHNHPNRISVDI